MSETTEVSHHVALTPDSSLAFGLHVIAALGDGAPRVFRVDTGSVGILAPRSVLCKSRKLQAATEAIGHIAVHLDGDLATPSLGFQYSG